MPLRYLMEFPVDVIFYAMAAGAYWGIKIGCAHET